MKESNTALLKKNKESNSYEEPFCSGSSFFYIYLHFFNVKHMIGWKFSMERKQEPLGFYKTRRKNGSGFCDISGILPAIFGRSRQKKSLD